MAINIKGIFYEGKIYLSEKLPDNLTKTEITVLFQSKDEEESDFKNLQLQMSEAKAVLPVTVDKSLHL